MPTYGIYAGYELVEDVPRPGTQEQIDNEKYQYKDRRWSDYEEGGPKAGQSLAPWLTMLNEARRAHPALHWLRNLRFHTADDDQILVFSKQRRLFDRDDVVLVVANLDPHSTRRTRIHLDIPALGLDRRQGFVAHDLVTGQRWNWREHALVHLGTMNEPVHIIHVESH